MQTTLDVLTNQYRKLNAMFESGILTRTEYANGVLVDVALADLTDQDIQLVLRHIPAEVLLQMQAFLAELEADEYKWVPTLTGGEFDPSLLPALKRGLIRLHGAVSGTSGH